MTAYTVLAKRGKKMNDDRYSGAMDVSLNDRPWLYLNI